MTQYIPWIAALVLVVVSVRLLFRRVIVLEYQRGLRYTKGRFRGPLEAGAYWTWRPSTRVDVIDVRSTFASISGQEILTSDGVTLKLSLAAKHRVADPVLASHSTDDYAGSLYLELQLALRSIVGELPIDDVLAQRGAIGARLLELVVPKAEELGLELQAVEVKDIMFPGALKQIFAQVAQAKQEGLAALERARGETAALRKLANAARLLENNPALAQLRLLDSLNRSSGNTVVIGMPGGTAATPLPIRSGSAEREPESGGES